MSRETVQRIRSRSVGSEPAWVRSHRDYPDGAGGGMLRLLLDTTAVCECSGPHVTGIQRAILGIWAGLTEQRLHVLPIRMDRVTGQWVPAGRGAFSHAALRMLPAGVFDRVHEELGAAPAGRRSLARQIARLIGCGQQCSASAALLRCNDVFLIGAMGWMCRHGDRATRSIARTGAMIVPLIHDIYPIVHPEWVDARFAVRYERWFRRLLRSSHRVLCVSRFTAEEVLSYCTRTRINAPEVAVIRLGDDHASRAKEPGSSLPVPVHPPYLVYVSSVDVRKNHELLLTAWRELVSRRGHRCPSLVWVGGGGEYGERLWQEVRADPAIRDHIIWLRDLDDSGLAAVVDRSAGCLYPSRYEGWGLPVAESLVRGKVCIVSRAASLTEICPSATPFIDPDDPGELVQIVERLLDDEAWVLEVEQRIKRAFHPTSWGQCASQVLAAFGGKCEVITSPYPA
jgi:glycosyltransferase involved in cell wall biosynthesis